MGDAGEVLLSVRAEARQLVAADYAVLDGLIEHTARSKEEALRSVSATLDRLTAALAVLGAVPFDEGTGRSPLTWSAHSSATGEDRYHDKETGRLVRSGQVTATVALRVTVRDLGTLSDLGGALAAQPAVHVHAVRWHVDWDNPAWRQVRGAAVRAAIGKARDYAAALGSRVRHVEHVADSGRAAVLRDMIMGCSPGVAGGLGGGTSGLWPGGGAATRTSAGSGGWTAKSG